MNILQILRRCVRSTKSRREARQRFHALGTARLSVELLEDRVCLATFTVTDGGDVPASGNNSTLRGVIYAAEMASGRTGAMETINFAVKTVTLDLGQLDITVPVTINGAGVTINCPASGKGGGLSFEASGNVVSGLTVIGNPGAQTGLTFGDEFGASNGNTVTGVTVDGFGLYQMAFEGNNNIVQGNFIGTDSAGKVKKGGNDGLVISGSGNTIGGVAAAQGNVISGLTGNGALYVLTTGAINNMIQGNFIGTDISGAKPIGNAGTGVFIAEGASNNTVTGNVISANGHKSPSASFAGVDVGDVGTTNNVIAGNFIGTDKTGTIGTGLGNIGDGVDVFGGASGNTIGGSIDAIGTAAGGNVISDSAVDGVSIWDDDTNVTMNNVVEGNYIGTDVHGTAALPNQGNGVSIVDGAANNTIGSMTAANRNVISGNHLNGVLIGVEPNPVPSDVPAPNNTVEGNYIGTDTTGEKALGNRAAGVVVNAPGNTVGGTVAGTGNLISANGGDGVDIAKAAAANNNVQGNFIGTNLEGTFALGNSAHGVAVEQGANNNVVGGLTQGSATVISPGVGSMAGGAAAFVGNLISGNTKDGVDVSGSTSTENRIQGNFIGTAANGGAALGNAVGIVVEEAANNSIGGDDAGGGGGNLISGNHGDGVDISSAKGGNVSGANNLVEGNFIGTDLAGGAALGNGGAGVHVSGASDNFIGGTVLNQGNLISGNAGAGVQISSSGKIPDAGADNLVQQNRIGTNLQGTIALANAAGVTIQSGSGNQIGGADPNARNIISGNTGAGVSIQGTTTAGNLVQGNYIGTQVNAAAALGNGGAGVSIGDRPSGGTAVGDIIGGQAAGAGNLISGNGGDGVQITAASTTANQVQGNYIGTDVAGTAALGNAANGVEIASAGNTVGGAAAAGSVLPGVGSLTTAFAGNLISGNEQNGILLSGTGNNVQENFIGADATGAAALGNAAAGIAVTGSSNVIGGIDEEHGNLTTNVISGNEGAGVSISASENQLQGNFIGTDVSGTAALKNGVGVLIDGGHNTIGGTTPAARNVISGNASDGVFISGAGASGNLIAGNYIGVDVTGIARLANDVGVAVSASNNTIGGTPGDKQPGAGNVISGNQDEGILIENSGAMNNKVTGNYIGTTSNGELPLGNGMGVSIDDAPNNSIGGSTRVAGNVISANLGDGVYVSGENASNTKIQGNYIGLDAAGLAELGNFGAGVSIDGAPGAGVGGSSVGAGNVISANGGDGIDIAGATAVANKVQGNFIGTGPSGTLVMGNAKDGILIEKGAAGTAVGGTTGLARNLISGNTANGVEIDGPAKTATTVQDNFIGTDVTGAKPLGNGGNGVLLEGASSATIGGGAAADSNVISGNGQCGVSISGGNGAAAAKNAVLGNYIGTSADGNSAVGNGVDGISVNDAGGEASGNVIGGTTTGSRNLISGNTVAGISLSGSGVSNTKIEGNYIGLNAAGATAVANGDGIDVTGAAGTVIGGTAAAARNVVSGNRGAGIRLDGVTAGLIEGNYLGTNAGGSAAVLNAYGVSIKASAGKALDNVIGGTAKGAGNLISGNQTAGILLDGSGVSGTEIQGNTIGANAAGSAAAAGFSPAGVGIEVEDAAGTVIGGTETAAQNVVSANGGDGIDVEGLATGTIVEGNAIGASAKGAKALGNGGSGIDLTASGNTVGGLAAGAGNVIAFNVRDGVDVSGASGDSVRGNSIFRNAGMGINLFLNLANQGNNGLAAPILTSAVLSGKTLTVQGTYKANAAVTLDLYANQAPGNNGFGQGQTFAGTVTVTAGANGAFTAKLFNVTVKKGQFLTAAANDQSKDTSEFSNALKVT